MGGSGLSSLFSNKFDHLFIGHANIIMIVIKEQYHVTIPKDQTCSWSGVVNIHKYYMSMQTIH